MFKQDIGGQMYTDTRILNNCHLLIFQLNQIFMLREKLDFSGNFNVEIGYGPKRTSLVVVLSLTGAERPHKHSYTLTMKPIKLDYLATIEPGWLAEVEKACSHEPIFGNVGIAKKFKNSWMRRLLKTALKEVPNFKPRDGLSKLYAIDVLYGKGSVGMHIDGGAGIVILTLLDCYPDETGGTPEHHYISGQLITMEGLHDMHIGQSCIVNTDEQHAWLCNGVWVFLSTSVEESSY